jgi:chromate transporter
VRTGLASEATGAARVLRTAALGLALWLGPVVAAIALLGTEDVFARMGVFFSKMAVVTFGGAYAVLAYVAQEAVATYRWLAPGEMLDGLALAETTPGPLIMVLAFVGFLAAFRDAGGLDPMLAGLLGAAFTTWVTFAPSFLWIFLGAPYMEALRGNRALAGALGAITAAVVGVVLNLALWFGLHVLFGALSERHRLGMTLLVPDAATLDVAALALTLAAAVLLLRFRIGIVGTLALCAAAGAAYRLLA